MLRLVLALGVLAGLVAGLAAVWRRRRAAAAPTGYAAALAHYEAGRLAEAEAGLRQAAQARPRFAEARFKLANVLAETGRRGEAEAEYRAALALRPDYPQALVNLGNLLRQDGRRDAAEDCYRRAAATATPPAEAFGNLAILLAEAGRTDAAEDAFRQALRSHPDRSDLHFNLGQLLAEAGRPAEAETAYREALRLEPGLAHAASALGVLLAQAGRHREAQACFRDALQANPGDVGARLNLALALADGGRPDEAENAYRQALALQPANADALAGLAALLANRGRAQEAEAAYRQALQIQPGRADTLHNLGDLLATQGRHEEAEQAYRHALRSAPAQTETLNDLGNLLMACGRSQAAAAVYRQGLETAPGHPKLLFNYGLACLLHGDFEPGWALWEYRWQSILRNDRPSFSQPRWDGRPYPGQTLLVHYEQGLGDGIQFFRFLPQAAALGGSLAVECRPALFRLFRGNLPAEVRLVVEDKDGLPDFDLYCPLMSLPGCLRIRLENLPAEAPYLRAPAQARTEAPRLAANPGAPRKVGLAWAGSPTNTNDRQRSLDFAQLEPLFAVPGITWVILQKDRRPAGFADLARQRGWLDPMPGVQDFADTAALIEQLDLVIGVDTSVIHLAGALGKPAWLLLPLAPDWRWLLGREDSPWYPSLRLFRQTEHQAWPPVIRRVAAALAAFAPTPSR